MSEAKRHHSIPSTSSDRQAIGASDFLVPRLGAQGVAPGQILSEIAQVLNRYD